MLNRANNLWLSVVNRLATRNPKLFVMGSNQIRRLFCDTFFLIVLVFPCLFSFLYFTLFIIIPYKFPSLFQIFNAKNTTWISNFAFASCVCLRIYYIIIYFPFCGCICIRNCVISFCPRTIWDKYEKMVEVRRLLRCPRYLLARYTRGFAKCMIQKKNRNAERIEPAISAFIVQPPYPLYHLILVVYFLCRSPLIAILYTPNLSR